MLRYVCLLALMAVFPTQGFNKLSPVSEKAEIRKVCEQQVNAWRTQDYQAEADSWAHIPAAMKMLTNGTRTNGWEKIGKQYKDNFTMDGQEFEPEFSIELSDFYIRINGKAALAVFDQHQIFANADGTNQLYETLEVRHLEKIDGAWKVVFQLTGPYDQSVEPMPDLSKMDGSEH
jgi:hypothetical protein